MFQVYAVREVGSRGVQKIGHTGNLRQRLYNLNTGNWRGIELTMILGTYPTKAEALVAEAYIHVKFENSRIRGEWFELTVAQLRELKVELGSI